MDKPGKKYQQQYKWIWKGKGNLDNAKKHNKQKIQSVKSILCSTEDD